MYRMLLFPGFRDKALTLSYDDGVVFDEKLIEIMTRRGLKGTFNLNSGCFAAQTGGRRLTKEDAKALYGATQNEVAVHGVKHFSLSEVDSAMQLKEVLDDRAALEEMFGRVVRGMAYANGVFDDGAVERLTMCNIAYARTVVSTERFDIPVDWLRMPATCHHDNPRLMELARDFLEKPNEGHFWRTGPRLFYLWGHSYEFDDNDNWKTIEDFASYAGGREDVWYATNGEIYDYVQAYRRLEFSAAGTMVRNPSASDVCLNYFGEKCLAPAGKTVSLPPVK